MGIMRGGIIGTQAASASGSAIVTTTAGVQSLESLSGIIDLDSPNQSIAISTSGQVIQLNAIFTPGSGALLESLSTIIVMKAVLNFTPASGFEFVLAHNLNTTDFTFTMWSTVDTPPIVMLPTNVYASGLNHAVVSLEVPTSGRIVLIG